MLKEMEVVPEWGDQYVNAEILLQRGGRMARGQEVHQKQYASNNPIDRSNQNPILDTCLYEVKFPGEEFMEMEANVIAEVVYAQCDVDGSEYLLLEAFVDQRRNGSALYVEDQMIVVKGKEILRKSTERWLYIV